MDLLESLQWLMFLKSNSLISSYTSWTPVRAQQSLGRKGSPWLRIRYLRMIRPGLQLTLFAYDTEQTLLPKRSGEFFVPFLVIGKVLLSIKFLLLIYNY